MTQRFMQFLAALSFAAFAASSMAQQAAPAAAPAAAGAPIPKPDCVKPGDFPGNLASDRNKQAWQKDYVGYVDCLKKFIDEQQALAEPHVKASNAAITEYNAGVKEYNEQIKKAKGD